MNSQVNQSFERLALALHANMLAKAALELELKQHLKTWEDEAEPDSFLRLEPSYMSIKHERSST